MESQGKSMKSLQMSLDGGVGGSSSNETMIGFQCPDSEEHVLIKGSSGN